MLVYKNTFDNIMTVGINFPIEDQYYASSTEAIVADGITRDPIGVDDLSKYPIKEMLMRYPRPSGAELAAKEACDSFSKTTGTLYDRLVLANDAIKSLNDKYIKECNYLDNDYYGTVAACIRIDGNNLEYAYICDCGVIIYDSEGNIKFKTEDDKEICSDPYINMIGIPWHLSEARVKVRSEYRNNPNNIVDGKCVSYGALTGEETAVNFIKAGSVELQDGDTVILYTDGFSYYLTDKEFINSIINFDKDSFENYVNNKSREDYEKYGKEKTLVMYKK